MKFSIGYNHDVKLLSLLDNYKDHIESFYFPIPSQYSGSGRAIITDNSYLDEIPHLIKKCLALNIIPQLLLNATCEGAQGFQERHFSKILNYIQKLRASGLQSIVITNPAHIHGIKKQIKGITIESSVNCYVKNVEHALYLRDLGVDILTIDRDINRDIPMIKNIKDKTGLKIKILLNEACLRNCPFRQMHFNYLAHISANSRQTSSTVISQDKWSEKFFVQDPTKIFSTSFIPPSALKYYVNLADRFKISTRQATTSFVELRLKAYIAQNFSGNLVSLLDCACLRPYYEYIDSRALDSSGFFKKMIKCSDDCYECGYCNKLMEKAVVTNSYFLNLDNPTRIKETKKAIKIYKNILKESPFDLDVLLSLSKTYFERKKYALAIQTVNRAIKLAPQEIKGYLILGYFLEQLKKNNEALALYRKTLELSLNNEDALLGISRVCFALKKYNEAIKNITLTIKLSHRKRQAHFLLGCCYEKIGQYKKAIPAFKKEKHISLDNSDINFALARCYRKLGNLEESDRHLSKGSIEFRKYEKSKYH